MRFARAPGPAAKAEKARVHPIGCSLSRVELRMFAAPDVRGGVK